MPHPDHSSDRRASGLRVTERIVITPSRRADERAAPLLVRFNPHRPPTSAGDEGRGRPTGSAT